jgi:ribosome-binding factor A
MPKEYPRSARLAAQLQQELSVLLRANLLRDPRVYGVDLAVTTVELAQDLSHAHVLISTLGDPARLSDAIAALNHAKGKLRGELGRRLKIRYIPELTFKVDESVREADKINRLLRDALEKDRKFAADRGEK